MMKYLVTLGLKVTDIEHLDIKRETCSQHSSKIWHEVHYKLITSSTCMLGYCVRRKTASLLVYCLHPKPFRPNTK